jgi:hypothetical protein
MQIYYLDENGDGSKTIYHYNPLRFNHVGDYDISETNPDPNKIRSYHFDASGKLTLFTRTWGPDLPVYPENHTMYSPSDEELKMLENVDMNCSMECNYQKF